MAIKTLVLTASIADHILKDPQILQEFPAFRSLVNHYAVPRVRQCCGKKTSALHQALPAIKSTILSLPPEALGRLKAKLNADQLILNFDVRGSIVRKEI